MLKRIFWLVLAGVAGWLLWQWFQRRQGEFAHTTPQFTAPSSFDRPSAPIATAPATPPAPPQTAERVAAEQARPAEMDQEVPERVPGAVEGATPIEGDSEAVDERAGGAAAAPKRPTDDVSAVTAAAITTASEKERATAEASNVVTPPEETLLDEQVVGYCVRCKTKRPIQGAHREITESGRRAARGTCPVCGANMFTFLKDEGNDQEAAADTKA